MTILSSELLWYTPAEVSDDTTNGGRMSASVITGSVKNNIFPDVSEADRTAGITQYRKVFIKVANDDDLSLLTPQVFIETQTSGEDVVTFFTGTQTDTQSGITGSERKYGAGALDSTVVSGVGSIDVTTEGGSSAPIFVAADTIRISDKTSVTDTGNNEEFHVITAVSYSGVVATLTLTGTLANGYAASATRVASIYSPGTIVSSFDTVVNSSSAGTFDSSTSGNVVVDNIGGVEQDWTLTFTSATVFNITGSVLGLVGTGTISTTTAPDNSDFTKPYFTIISASFGGTFVATDTITFSTRPASVPLWYERVVSAGATSIGNNNFITAIDGESS